jgi:hypothetical protein
MPLTTKIDHWMKYPNALGFEAQAAVLVGAMANALNEDVPSAVSDARKTLALRGTMRDVAQAIHRREERGPAVPAFHDIVDIGAAAAGLSWTKAISAITSYLLSGSERLGESSRSTQPRHEAFGNGRSFITG